MASFIIDAHLDLSMNAMEWNRDLRESISEIREREKGMTDKPDRGNGVVSFDQLRKGTRIPRQELSMESRTIRNGCLNLKTSHPRTY